MKLPNHTALKEWASVVSAVTEGDQSILVRKGGIADAGFGVESDRFYLFPTYLHQKERQFKPALAWHARGCEGLEENPPEVPISTWCEVVEEFQIRELEALRALEPFVIFTAETLEQRYRFRPDQAVQVIAVRAWKLERPLSVTNRPGYAGCRSWISLEEGIDVTGSRGVLAEAELQRRIELIAQAAGLTRRT